MDNASSFAFHVEAEDGAARAGLLATPHGQVPTPAFMPVATQASVKSLTPQEVRHLGTSILLANSYHLYLRPGVEVVRETGGLHRFMAWDFPILTDSGGFQAYSMGELRQVTEEGLLFTSHLDGSRHFLTPVDSIRCQEALGADLITCLDECIPYGVQEEEARRAMDRTHRWAQQCREAHTSSQQALFGIVQGGLFPNLRKESARAITAVGFEGHAVGGLSVGEPKEVFYAMAAFTAGLLPREKPRYLMGVGSPEDLVEAVAAGYDLFDCALPTRVARNGGIYTRASRVDVTTARFRSEKGPLEQGCDCAACTGFSTGYIHHLFRARELLAYRLATIHNLRFFQRLMAELRQAVETKTLQLYRRQFLEHYAPSKEDVRLEQRRQWRGRGRGAQEET
ncbi:MAG: tRNA guanosine(34) transglycosylase Tgt [Chloroflexi bacterium]|nr:tRNA guanosine(34) transglycosylase Tgt [Chloroflexota bacterium]